jgi:hypothetical protein
MLSSEYLVLRTLWVGVTEVGGFFSVWMGE